MHQHSCHCRGDPGPPTDYDPNHGLYYFMQKESGSVTITNPGSGYTNGTYSVMFNADGACTQKPSMTYRLRMAPSGPLEVTAAPLAQTPAGTTTYSQSFAPWVSSGTPPHGNYTVVSGALPGGLTLDLSTGLISGVVTGGAGRTTSQSAFRIPLRPQPPAERHRSRLTSQGLHP